VVESGGVAIGVGRWQEKDRENRVG